MRAVDYDRDLRLPYDAQLVLETTDQSLKLPGGGRIEGFSQCLEFYGNQPLNCRPYLVFKSAHFHSRICAGPREADHFGGDITKDKEARECKSIALPICVQALVELARATNGRPRSASADLTLTQLSPLGPGSSNLLNSEAASFCRILRTTRLRTGPGGSSFS